MHKRLTTKDWSDFKILDTNWLCNSYSKGGSLVGQLHHARTIRGRISESGNVLKLGEGAQGQRETESELRTK
jgi:hypothetical protein